PLARRDPQSVPVGGAIAPRRRRAGRRHVVAGAGREPRRAARARAGGSAAVVRCDIRPGVLYQRAASFADRVRFFHDARRILKPGGALMSIGKDPHADRDSWWVYDYFPETLPIDRDRFARVRVLRGELAQAGFAWAESFEADRIEAVMPAGDAL